MTISHPAFKPLVGALTAALLAAAFFLSSPAMWSRDGQDSWKYFPGPLKPGDSAGQTFWARENGLARLDVRLGTYKRPLVAGVDLTLVEIDADQARPVHLDQPVPVARGGLWSAELFGDRQMAQTFVPNRDGLSGVSLLVGARQLRPEATARLRVWAPDGGDVPGRLLAEVTAPAAALPRRDYHVFAFPPLTGVRGRPLMFTIDAPDATPGAGLLVDFQSDVFEEEIWPYQRGYRYPDGRAVMRSDLFPESVTHDHRRYFGGGLAFRLVLPPALPTAPATRRSGASGWRLGDNVFNAFTFAPIDDSRNRRYYFFLQSRPGWGAPPSVSADTADRYTYGALTLNHVPSHGALSFRAWYLMDRAQAWDRLLTLAVKNKPGPFGGRGLLVALTIAHALLAGLMVGWLWLVGRP